MVMTTGSTVLCGIAACPPRPYTVIVTASDIERKKPGWYPIVPAGIVSSS